MQHFQYIQPQCIPYNQTNNYQQYYQLPLWSPIYDPYSINMLTQDLHMQMRSDLHLKKFHDDVGSKLKTNSTGYAEGRTLVNYRLPDEYTSQPRPILRPTTCNTSILVESKATQTSPELMAHLASHEQVPTAGATIMTI